jgi:hypothetical protein
MAIKFVVEPLEVKDEDVDQITFSLKPSCNDTVTHLSAVGTSFIGISSRSKDLYIDKSSIDPLILALQEAKRLWGDS